VYLHLPYYCINFWAMPAKTKSIPATKNPTARVTAITMMVNLKVCSLVGQTTFSSSLLASIKNIKAPFDRKLGLFMVI
jgi:hypothetical protein